MKQWILGLFGLSEEDKRNKRLATEAGREAYEVIEWAMPGLARSLTAWLKPDAEGD